MPRTRRAKKTSLPKIDEHTELVSRVQGLGVSEAGASEALGTSEAGASGASGAGASGAGGTLEEEFYRAQGKTLKLQKVEIMAQVLKPNVELTGFEKLRNTVEYCDISPDLRESMLEMVAELEINLPTVFEWTKKPVDICDMLQKAYPEWDMKRLVNLVGVLTGSISSTSTRTSSNMSGFFTFSERGHHALESRVDLNLPMPVDDDTAQQIWPSECWITNEGPGRSMASMLRLLSKRESMKTSCAFEFRETGTIESVCGKGSKPDLLLVLKDAHADVYTTGAIISLHSKGAASKFNNADSVGQAIQYGLKFLRTAGAVRKYIFVGITDLKEIIWFKVTDDDLDEYCTHVPATGKVRQSLCAFLLAEPASLGVAVGRGVTELSLPHNWQWKRILGYGRTSKVHEINIQGISYAVKIPNVGMCLVKDFVYLSRLKGVDGIPSIHTQVGDMLVLKPVGHPFSFSSLQKFKLMQSLPQLVDILKAAHDLGYVNRDIRVENLMVAKSLQQPRERLFILDWGFAAECGAECQFAGCLYTSSNNVLSQLLIDDKQVTYSGADDLVAVIRCMRMFVDSRIAKTVLSNCKYSKGKEQVDSVMHCWELCMSADTVWEEVERKAQNADYDGVKDFLRLLGSCVAGMA